MPEAPGLKIFCIPDPASLPSQHMYAVIGPLTHHRAEELALTPSVLILQT